MHLSYLQDIKKIIRTLTMDEELILEDKLFLLGMVNHYIESMMEQLEDELAAEEGV